MEIFLEPGKADQVEKKWVDVAAQELKSYLTPAMAAAMLPKLTVDAHRTTFVAACHRLFPVAAAFMTPEEAQAVLDQYGVKQRKDAVDGMSDTMAKAQLK